MTFSLAVHNNSQEKLHISLVAERNRQGYILPWQFAPTPKEINFLGGLILAAKKFPFCGSERENKLKQTET
jgi:hypothetical protein